MDELLLALKAAIELTALITGVAAQAYASRRDPTPEELATVKAKQDELNKLADELGM